MDIFDQYLYEELTTQYARPALSADDYEELYQRFCNMDYLAEVKPYLLTMRFFGLGTAAEKDTVLSELKAMLNEDDCMLKGLYYDLLLSENSNNTDAIVNLRRMVDEGYTNKFTKDNSYANKVETLVETSLLQDDTSESKSELIHEDVEVTYISFMCGKYTGLSFAAGEIDYLYAIVYINPLKFGKRHITVRSQIFLDNEPFSQIFTDEIDIDTNTTWFRTNGWGNTNKTCYSSNIYNWVIKIDGERTFSQTFTMHSGKLDILGPNILDVRLFDAKWAQVLESDHTNYKITFNSSELECIYFKFIIIPPRENMLVQINIKIIYLEDNSVLGETTSLANIQSYWDCLWAGYGYDTPGNWKKGLYQYSVNIGTGKKYEGTFTVY